MTEVLELINQENGFMVSFDRVTRGGLTSDHFPDKSYGEELIKSEHDAWAYARKFANALKGQVINVYVIDQNHNPVPNYKKHMLNKREEHE